MKKKNVIIGVVKNYSYKKIRPFVKSLRDTGFNGDIVLFCNEVPKKTIKQLKAEKVIVKEFKIKSHEHLIPAKQIEKIPYDQLPLMSYRFILYLDFLLENKEKYENIMLSDIGDVIFQKDPFDFNIGKMNCFFLMNCPIKEAPAYVSWLKKVYGIKIFNKLKNKNMSCAGTFIADYDNMIKYLKLMKQEIFKGNDQCVHNYICYSGVLKNIKLFENGDVIATVASKQELQKAIIVKKNKVFSKKGELINIIHGYNRHKILSNIFGGNKESKIIRKLKNSKYITQKGNSLRKKLYKIPFLGKKIRQFYQNTILK
ncbi:hypothetical protein GOV14_06775 [Candidatus Pacearchaeota archaeon]|nr:hypothetical protein [Candidatus Pacearchaeota archaeon]